jgi:hypothetical protein
MAFHFWVDVRVGALAKVPEKTQLVDSTLEGFMETYFKEPDTQTE